MSKDSADKCKSSLKSLKRSKLNQNQNVLTELSVLPSYQILSKSVTQFVHYDMQTDKHGETTRLFSAYTITIPILSSSVYKQDLPFHVKETHNCWLDQ